MAEEVAPPAAEPEVTVALTDAPVVEALKPADEGGALTDTPPKVEAKPADTEPKPVAEPLKLEDFTLPEGMAADADAMAAFKTILADPEADFSTAKGRQAFGQKLVELQAGQNTKVAGAIENHWRDTQKAWQKEVMEDKDLGGAKWPETRASVNEALTLLDPSGEARTAFAMTGAGNNPAIIRMLHKASTMLTEGGHVGGKPPVAAPKTVAEAMWPNMQPTGTGT